MVKKATTNTFDCVLLDKGKDSALLMLKSNSGFVSKEVNPSLLLAKDIEELKAIEG